MSVVYRVPGQHFAGKHASGVDVTYDYRESHDGDPPAGWHATLEEAVAARFAPAPVAAPPVAEESVTPAAEPADDLPPTREELEAQAAKYGVKIDRRWSDRRIMQAIADHLERS